MAVLSYGFPREVPIFYYVKMPRIHSIQLVLACLCLCVGGENPYAAPPTYGFEFNFTNPKIVEHFAQRHKARKKPEDRLNPDEYEHEAVVDFKDEVVRRCGSACRVTSIEKGKFGFTEFKVELADGWWFDISVDPGVVEIRTKPSTLAELQQHREEIQRYIFEAKDQLKMKAFFAPKKGGARDLNSHFNIGVKSAFGNDVRGFLAFFTDYANHPELALGILGQDLHNGPPLRHLKPAQRKALDEILVLNREGRITSLEQAAKLIEQQVYPHHATKPHLAGNHYQALTVRKVANGNLQVQDEPAEIRPVRQPESFEKTLMLAELMEARIAYVIEHKLQIHFQDSSERSPNEYDRAREFFLYVNETGLDWNHYKELAPPKACDDRYLDPFLLGKINWRNKQDLAWVHDYVDRLGSSPWLRAQMLKKLAQSDAAETGNGIMILREIAQTFRERGYGLNEPEMAQFFSEAFGLHDWAKQYGWAEPARPEPRTLEASSGLPPASNSRTSGILEKLRIFLKLPLRRAALAQGQADRNRADPAEQRRQAIHQAEVQAELQAADSAHAEHLDECLLRLMSASFQSP